jgi:hypothetical protein
MADDGSAEIPDQTSDWVDSRVGMASAAKPVSERTASLVKAAMRSKMADRQLPAGELAKLAKELLATLGDEAK